MIETAMNKSAANNVSFTVSSEKLETISETFDVIINRHAPFDLQAVTTHLKTGGYFITQQVGEKNMENVKVVLGQETLKAPIQKEYIMASGLKIIAFMEYNVEYVVQDIESLIFWLNALDSLHADVEGAAALTNVERLNAILRGNVDERGFVTNEHRYLAVAQK